MIKTATYLLLMLLSMAASANQAPTFNWAELIDPIAQDDHADIHSVMINHQGKTVFEQYYNGGDENTLVDVRSAGKSVTAILMGIAMDQQHIKSLNDSVADYWMEAKDTAVGAVPLKHLLTMRSGLDADADDETSFGYEDFIDASDDPQAFALTVPKTDAPGNRYRYNSHAAYLAGIVVGEATGQEMGQVAEQYLFRPLKINQVNWQEDRSGLTKGQGNLFINAQGFTGIGQMVLDGGRFEDQQIVSSTWVNQMLQPWVDTAKNNINAAAYGYYWYQQFYPINDQPIEVWYASGNGGNKIYLMPELEMVVTVMSDAYGQGRSHRRSERILLAVLKQAVNRRTL